jgi:hypothetical protein
MHQLTFLPTSSTLEDKDKDEDEDEDEDKDTRIAVASAVSSCFRVSASTGCASTILAESVFGYPTDIGLDVELNAL